MPIFPRLPLLDSAFPITASPSMFEDIALICVQHLLETTGSLFEKFIELGFPPNQIHVLGKLYSTNGHVKRQLSALGVNVYDNGSDFAWGEYSERITEDIASMWRQALKTGAFDRIRKIIVLDDGGGNIAAVPPVLVNSLRVIGVEQTMSGITLNRSERPLISFVGVGSSAAKVLMEPRIIQEALFRRVAQKATLGVRTAGVVGTGYIGRAVIAGLKAAGVQVLAYDKYSSQQRDLDNVTCETLGDLYMGADTIWGCTGTDHLFGHEWMRYLNRDKTLISCSSKDSEFRSALTLLSRQSEEDWRDRRSDVVLKTPSASVRILGGGFPINFDGPLESEPAQDIQLTRALLFSGVLQAASWNEDTRAGSVIDLDPHSQVQAVTRWLELHPERRSWYSKTVLNTFRNVDSVRFYRTELEQVHSIDGADALASDFTFGPIEHQRP